MALTQSEIFEDEFPLVRSCPALNEIRLAEEIKDLTIEVQDGAVLHTHRIILAARILSLRKTLSGPSSGQNTFLKWPTVPLSVATVFINYVYTGQAELTQANVRAVVMFARIVKLPVLENWGHNFMANRVTFENLATTWDFASSFKIDLLKEKCLSLMRQRFAEFVATDLFLRMPADTVLTLLRSDDLSVESEEQVIGAISRWVGVGDKADGEKVKVHAPVASEDLRVPQLPHGTLPDLSEKPRMPSAYVSDCELAWCCGKGQDALPFQQVTKMIGAGGLSCAMIRGSKDPNEWQTWRSARGRPSVSWVLAN